MSREIKFRIWDRELGKMQYGICPCQIDYYSQGHPNNYYLMQYTGLHDEKNKEIYEGDIINRPYQDGSYDRKVVKSCDGGWNPFIDDMTTDKSFRYEVIGNIYENTELLIK